MPPLGGLGPVTLPAPPVGAALTRGAGVGAEILGGLLAAAKPLGALGLGGKKVCARWPSAIVSSCGECVRVCSFMVG